MGTKQGYAITTWRLRLRCKHPEWLETTQNFYNEIQKFYYDLYLERPELWKENSQNALRGLETLSIPGRTRKQVEYSFPWDNALLYFRRSAANAAIAAAKSYLTRSAGGYAGKTETFHSAVTYYKGMYRELTSHGVELRVWTGDEWHWMHCRLYGKEFPEDGQLMSPSVVYEHPYTMLQVPVKEVVQDASNVFVPKVNRIVAETNDNTELTTLFTKVGRIQFIVLGLILTGFVFFGMPFVNLWAGEGYGASYAVALLLIIPVTVPLIQNLGIEIQRAKNMHKARAVVYLAIAIANVFISIPLIKFFGPEGAALGTAISLFAGNIIFMNWYYHARIGMNMFYFWKEIAKFIPALIAPCVVGIAIMKFVNITGLVKLGVFAVVYAAVYGLSMYFFGMNEEEKQLVMGPIRKILRK